MTRSSISTANRIVQRTRVRARLKQITHSVTSDSNLCEDLLQEAVIFLWQQLQRHPGQTWSWYLQGCRFHLRNELRRGSSIHSLKHRHLLDRPDAENQDVAWETSDPSTEILLSSISADDIMAELSQHLDPTTRALLPYLAQGLGMREIAHLLGVSHPTIIRRCRKIASVALGIGIS